MSTITRLLILGLVRWTQPVHGYDVRRELLSWNADEWANVAPGSIYHALKRLTEEEMLREVATEQVGARPARTKYEITEKGENYFQDLIREYWWEVKPAPDPFFAALSLLPALPEREAAAALRNRARVLRGSAQSLTTAAEEGMLRSSPPHVAEMFRLAAARAETDADWCERVAGRVEAGDLSFEVSSNNQT